MEIKEIIALIESCEELILPNGATGAIWKYDLINKLREIECDHTEALVSKYAIADNARRFIRTTSESI